MKEKILIKRVETIEECLKCNQMLEDLISFESKLDKQINPSNKVENYYEKTLNKNDVVLFVAKCGEDIVGYVSAYKEKENPALNNNLVKIMHLFVRNEYRKQYIGKNLIEKVEIWAKNEFKNFDLELDCVTSNVNAIDFYKHLGYNPVRIKMRKEF